MGLNIEPFDRSLWRIAELGSRCSDQSWPGDRDQAGAAAERDEAIRANMAARAETVATAGEGRAFIDDGDGPDDEATPPVVDGTNEPATEVPAPVLPVVDEEDRYLHVGATIGGLL